MIEHGVQSGYVIGLDKPYIFTYDGELLQLVPKDETSIKRYDGIRNKNIECDVLEGNTIGGDKIFFLNCQLNVFLAGYIAKPAGYVCFDKGERNFDVVTFKGGIIDYFYPPNHIVDKEKTRYDHDTGEATLKLKSFDDICKHIEIEVDGKKATLTLGVTLPGEPLDMQINYNLGKPQSIFRLTFVESIDVTEFNVIYIWISNLMKFLNFRGDISMGKIELGKINEEKRCERIGYVYLNEKEKNDISNVDKVIGYRFVIDHINELLQIVNKENLNLLFIPQNEKVDKYLSVEKYVICCTSFESVFNYVFPNAKTENMEKSNEVKDEFMEYIEEKRKEYKGKDKKKRKEFKKYADIIELLDFGLAEKFDYCDSQYKTSIAGYKNKILHRFNFAQEELEDLSSKFADKRNMFTHSGVGDFENSHIFAYMLARAFIYIMILDKAKMDSAVISQAIDKIL